MTDTNTVLPVFRETMLVETDALFLDFDGTLAPIQDDPESVSLEPEMFAVLEDLSEQLADAIALISGRGLSDLAKRVPQGLWRFGNHGLFSAAPNELVPVAAPPTPAGLLNDIEAACAIFDGVRVEPKGPVVAIHYRAAPESREELEGVLTDIIRQADGYKIQHGKCVYEAKPVGANKGISLANTMSRDPFIGRRPVMFGDDTTDEDAFIAAKSLGGLAIKVGVGPTSADYRVADVTGVHEILKEFVCRLRV